LILEQTRNPWYKYILSAQHRLIKTDTIERLTTALEAEPQGYRHFLNTIIRLTVALGTTLLLQSRTPSLTLVKAK